MPWRPLPRIAFAICNYPFQPTSAADLPLQIGDELYIIEKGGKDDAWFRGYLVAPPSLLAGLTSNKGQALEARVFSGIFPKVCVEIKEELADVVQSGLPDERNGDVQLTAPTGHKSQLESPALVLPDDFPAPPRGFPTSTNKPGQDGENERKTPTQNGVATNSAPANNKTARKPPAPVPMLKIGDESGATKQEPLVDEIASCLREWHSTNLHELMLNNKYDLLDEMMKLVRRLDSVRRQLLHKILTSKELQTVRDSAVWDLVHGNRILTGEVVVRSSSKLGRLLTADDSPIEMSSLQSMMSLLSDQPTPAPDTKKLSHVLFGLKAFTNEMQKPVTLSIALFALDESRKPKQVSESFAIDAPLGAIIRPGESQHLRTLFTDIGVSDIQGASGEAPHLFLVVKGLTSEAMRHSTRIQQGAYSFTEASSSFFGKSENSWPARNSTLRNARRSVIMSGKRVKDELMASSGSRSKAENSAPAKTEPSNLSSSDAVGGKTVRRTTALGVLEITGILEMEGEVEREMSIFHIDNRYSDSSIAEETEDEDFEAAALLGMADPIKESERAGIVRIGLSSFTHQDSAQLIQSTPTVLSNVPSTRKIGFTEAPISGRSDIYLKIMEPLIMANAFLSHPKQGNVPLPLAGTTNNLQLTLEVRNASGDRVENCIYPFSNSAGQTAWRTTGAERGEKWDQTIRLDIDADEVPGSHVVMSIADASVGFPFALAWMPLWTQDAFIRDDEHTLALHAYDEYTSDMIAGKRAYLDLPWKPKAKDDSSSGTMATLQLRTYLCSTAYSQDPVLIGLLKWEQQRDRDLLSLFERLPFVPELEIVKLLEDILDILFAILVHFSGNDHMEDSVLNSLVIVLGIVHDRRFNLQPRIDRYIKGRFHYPLAFPALIRSFRRLLADPTDPSTARKVRSVSKVGNQIFRLIVTAWKQQRNKKDSTGQAKHAQSIASETKKIFKDMENIISDPKPILIGTKTLLVQNFASLLLELNSAASSFEILKIAISFINACSTAEGKLIIYKLLMIKALAAAQVFRRPNDVQLWHENVYRWMLPYWAAPSPITQQWRDQIRVCCSILASQRSVTRHTTSMCMPYLIDAYVQILRSPQPPSESLSLLFPSAYPFPSKPANHRSFYDETLIEISSLLADVSGNSNNYSFNSNDALASMLSSLLEVMLSVIEGEAFPQTWLSLHIFHHRATLETLQAIYDLLSDRFLPLPEDAEIFPTELWNRYFFTLLKLVSSPALALETFAEQKRRAIWKIGGDIRELGAELLQKSWDAIAWDASVTDKELYQLEKMGGYQVQYVPKLVSPIVELCLSVHEGLRRAAISLLKTMMIAEWALAGDLRAIETEMINALDRMFKEQKNVNDGALQRVFLRELYAKFEPYRGGPSDKLFQAAKDLFGVVNELIGLLVTVHDSDAGAETHRIVDTIRLMEFLRGRQKESIFIGYVHKLSEMHVDAQNFVEAGLALRMHADLYDWNASKVLEPLREPPLPAQTALERKEYLYFEIIKHFEEGQAWYQALATYEELASVYEKSTYDFAKLARTQRAMAAVHEEIHRGKSQPSRFFRVKFRGLGFSTNLRDKEFIFEGSPMDRITSFADKMLRQYPSARIVNSSIEDGYEGQYISIVPVGPQKDFLHPVNRQLRVRQSVRDHYMLANPTKFTMSSRRQASTGTVEEEVQDKTVYTTAESFPNILRRSEIVESKTIRLSPVQIGLERAIRKTHELLALEEKAQNGTSSSMAFLTESLRGLTQSHSPNTIARYWKLVPKTNLTNGDDASEPTLQNAGAAPIQEALKVALLDHVMVISRCLSLYSNTVYLATRAELTRDFEHTFAVILEAFKSISGQTDLNNQPWLWNLGRPNPTAEIIVTTEHKRDPSDTRGGTLEYGRTQPGTIVDRSNTLRTIPGQGDVTENDTGKKGLRAFWKGKGDDALLSSRSSMYMGDENGTLEGNENAKQGTDGFARPVSPMDMASRSSSLQTRVSRRLSQLSFGARGKSSKDKARTKTVETVEE